MKKLTLSSAAFLAALSSADARAKTLDALCGLPNPTGQNTCLSATQEDSEALVAHAKALFQRGPIIEILADTLTQSVADTLQYQLSPKLPSDVRLIIESAGKKYICIGGKQLPTCPAPPAPAPAAAIPTPTLAPAPTPAPIIAAPAPVAAAPEPNPDDAPPSPPPAAEPSLLSRALSALSLRASPDPEPEQAPKTELSPTSTPAETPFIVQYAPRAAGALLSLAALSALLPRLFRFFRKSKKKKAAAHTPPTPATPPPEAAEAAAEVEVATTAAVQAETIARTANTPPETLASAAPAPTATPTTTSSAPAAHAKVTSPAEAPPPAQEALIPSTNQKYSIDLIETPSGRAIRWQNTLIPVKPTLLRITTRDATPVANNDRTAYLQSNLPKSQQLDFDASTNGHLDIAFLAHKEETIISMPISTRAPSITMLVALLEKRGLLAGTPQDLAVPTPSPSETALPQDPAPLAPSAPAAATESVKATTTTFAEICIALSTLPANGDAVPALEARLLELMNIVPDATDSTISFTSGTTLDLHPDTTYTAAEARQNGTLSLTFTKSGIPHICTIADPAAAEALLTAFFTQHDLGAARAPTAQTTAPSEPTTTEESSAAAAEAATITTGAETSPETLAPAAPVTAADIPAAPAKVLAPAEATPIAAAPTEAPPEAAPTHVSPAELVDHGIAYHPEKKVFLIKTPFGTERISFPSTMRITAIHGTKAADGTLTHLHLTLDGTSHTLTPPFAVALEKIGGEVNIRKALTAALTPRAPANTETTPLAPTLETLGIQWGANHGIRIGTDACIIPSLTSLTLTPEGTLSLTCGQHALTCAPTFAALHATLRAAGIPCTKGTAKAA